MKKERRIMVEILDRNGWAASQTSTLKIGGKKRTVYSVEPYPFNLERIKPVSYDVLNADLRANFPHVWEGKSRCEYAPEIKKTWVSAW